MTVDEIFEVSGGPNSAHGHIVRIELHAAAGDDEYLTLHSRMREAGFRRYLTSGGGFYKLPRGSYHDPAPALLSKNVAKRAGDIAAAIRPSPSIIVTVYDSSAWALESISQIEASKL